MSNIKEIIINFVKSSYPVKLDVLAQTVSRKSSTFNYNLFEILDELIKEKDLCFKKMMKFILFSQNQLKL